jgi:hypothetical protein
VWVDGDELYVFVGLGSCPANMGCLRGDRHEGASGLRACDTSPIIEGSRTYGYGTGAEAAEFFDFRYLTSAEVVRDGDLYYMLYEGERGPTPPPGLHPQWGLGLAFSPAIDAAWSKYPGNPILFDLPGNVGLGHADLIEIEGAWYLYTATSDTTRGRYRLVWSTGEECPAPKPPMPDVTLLDLAWTPASPQPGDALRFVATVHNRGDAATDAVVGVGFHVDGVQVGWATVSGLDAGQTAALEMIQTWTATAGPHDIAAYVDDINRFEESDESNNGRGAALTVE